MFFIGHGWDTWYTWWCHTGQKTAFLPVKKINVSVKEQFSVAEWVGTFLLKPQSVLPERLPVVYLFRCLWLQRRSLTASIKHSAAARLRWPRAATPARVSLGRSDGQGGRHKSWWCSSKSNRNISCNSAASNNNNTTVTVVTVTVLLLCVAFRFCRTSECQFSVCWVKIW